MEENKRSLGKRCSELWTNVILHLFAIFTYKLSPAELKELDSHLTCANGSSPVPKMELVLLTLSSQMGKRGQREAWYRWERDPGSASHSGPKSPSSLTSVTAVVIIQVTPYSVSLSASKFTGISLFNSNNSTRLVQLLSLFYRWQKG